MCKIKDVQGKGCEKKRVSKVKDVPGKGYAKKMCKEKYVQES